MFSGHLQHLVFHTLEMPTIETTASQLKATNKRTNKVMKDTTSNFVYFKERDVKVQLELSKLVTDFEQHAQGRNSAFFEAVTGTRGQLNIPPPPPGVKQPKATYPKVMAISPFRPEED